MGSKYTTNSISGYNSTPPADDGSQTEANKVKWSTIKNKLTDPIKTLAETINSEVATALDYGPVSVVSAAVTLGATHHNQFVELSGAATPTLDSSDGLGAGWFVDVKNVGSQVITVAREKTNDTIDGLTADVTMNPLDYIRFVVNAAASGFYTIPVQIATNAEVLAGTRSTGFVTPKGLASIIATQAEVHSGSDAAKYVTPASLVPLSVSDNTGFRVVYLNNFGGDADYFDVRANITGWESVGPTTVSADNVWTALDSIPSNAKAILVNVYIIAAGETSGQPYSALVKCRKTGTSTNAGISNYIGYSLFNNTSGGLEQAGNTREAFIPLDSSRRFDLTYSTEGPSVTSVCQIGIRGYGI